jgi:hypothetical protein
LHIWPGRPYDTLHLTLIRVYQSDVFLTWTAG